MCEIINEIKGKEKHKREASCDGTKKSKKPMMSKKRL